MIKTKYTYRSVLSKHLIVLGFFLLLVAKPIVNTIFVLNNSNNEWFNFFDKVTSEEKEFSTNFEDENIVFNHLTQILFCSKVSKSTSYVKQENIAKNYSLDILLPPPKLLKQHLFFL